MPPGLGSLAIYSGLEIDAAKTGVRPNLDEFLGGRRVKRTPFLQYKYLVERAEERRRAWYEPTHRERLETFFAGIDWDMVDSPRWSDYPGWPASWSATRRRFRRTGKGRRVIHFRPGAKLEEAVG